MRTNELRIRNLLLDDRGVITKVYFLNDDEINNDDLTVNYKPIPLTPELLEKCGFTKVGPNYEKDWLLLHTHLERQTFDFLLYESSSGKLKATPILYLHQLQNLYFTFTGEELEINLEEK